MWFKSVLGLKFENKIKTQEKGEEFYETAPVCKYPLAACICKRQQGSGPVKCFYKYGTKKCCFEREEAKEILEK